jgi:hypothetical protein
MTLGNPTTYASSRRWLALSGIALALGACSGELEQYDDLATGETGLSAVSALVRRGSGKCLDVAARGTADGTKIQQWVCNQTPAQDFQLDEKSNGEVRIINTHSGKCLDVTGNGVSDGTQLQIWPCHEGPAQRFRLESVGGSFVQLRNPQSGKCIDVNGNSGDDGAKVQIWTCNGTDAQAWSIDALEGGDGDGDGDGDPPDIFAQFASTSGWSQHIRSPGGAITLSSHGGAEDGRVAALSIPGRPDLGAGDWSNPGFASELEFNESFLYGKFETRVRFASCAAHEEVVNGLFTYFRGGDQNGNGITDNSEIDIELLCGTPHILWLTTYTDFDDFSPGRLRKLSRKIDMRTGRYEVFTDWPPALTDSGTVPGVALAGFPDPNQFYTVGFEWRANAVRYYIRLGGREVDLFTITDPSRIPRRSAGYLMNIWHANAHWTDGSAADYPSNTSTMLIDWVKIWR